MKKFPSIAMLLLIVMFSVSAEEQSVYSEFDDALGVFYGEIVGAGLSYQHWFDELGLQTVLGLFYYPEASSPYTPTPGSSPYEVNLFDYNIGIEGQLMVYEDSYSDWLSGNLYIFAGLAHTGSVRRTISDTVGAPVYYPGASVGFGFGFEPVFFQHFSAPLEFGLGGSWEFDSIVPVSAGLEVQGGLRYRF